VKILITGVTGRIGANVAQSFIDSGHEVTGFVWPGDPQIKKMEMLGCKIIQGDLIDLDAVKDGVNDQNYVFHLGAAFQAGGPFSPSQYFDTNVKGTFNVLEACKESESISHLIVTSTDGTIPKYPEGGIEEPIAEFSLPQDVTDWYGYSKILAENLCRRFYHGEKLPVTVLRFSMVMGRGEVCGWSQFYTGHFIELLQGISGVKSSDALKVLQDFKSEGKELIVPRDVNGRSWKKHVIDIRDIVHAYENIAGNLSTLGKTYQIAGKEPFLWENAIPRLSEITGLDYCSSNLPINPTFYEFDLSASKRDFGFNPIWDIGKMMEDDFNVNEEDNRDVIPTDEEFRREYKI
tara:strand:+ start:153 stop:1196 length:1044 start_codon:yes stop_codon:yes gene_type:complete